MCIRTPSNLELLIHCHVSPQVHPRFDAPTIKEGIRDLVNAGLIERVDHHYGTTEKGKFYIAHLLKQPFPVITFAIPEVK